MKRFFTLLIIVMAIIGQMRAGRNWTPPTGGSAHDAVIYAVLKDAGGEVLKPGTHVTLGAFIGNECRAVATAKQASSETQTPGEGVFTLRIPVSEADANATVNFVLKLVDSNSNHSSEYTLAETITVSGGDQTINMPSQPKELAFTPISDIGSTTISVNVGESARIADYMEIFPQGANLPDDMDYDFANSASYISVADGKVTGLAPNTDGCFLGLGFVYYNIAANDCFYLGPGATVYVYQPITGIKLTDPSVSEVTVNVNDADDLTAKLYGLITVTPANATEDVLWQSSDDSGVSVDEYENGKPKLTPLKAGTYTVTASCEDQSINPIEITVNVIQPVTGIAMNDKLAGNGLTVVQGTNVTKFIPYLYTITPADASHQGAEYISVSYQGIFGGENPFLEDGTAAIIGSGATGWIVITHSDLPNDPVYVAVSIIKGLPENANVPDFSTSLPENLLKETNIQPELKSHFESALGGTYKWERFVWATSDAAILNLPNNGVREVYPQAYGTATLTGSMTIYVSDFDSNNDFQVSMPKTGQVPFNVSIAQGLTSISVNDIKMAVGGTYTMTINTVPEGIDLNDISLSIPEITSGVPYFTAERIAGTNNYTLTGEYPAVEAFSITADGVSTRAWVYIGQEFAFEEGWSWISNYAIAPLELSSLKNLQEVRSQTALTYNDPSYGWFGDLEEMGQEMYKVNVATGKSFSFLNISQNIGFNNGNHDFTVKPGYNWWSNPYCHDFALNDVFAGMDADGWKVIGQNGFAEGDTQGFNGSLEALKAGDGYIVYNPGTSDVNISTPGELTLTRYVAPTTQQSAPARRARQAAALSYNPRKFADNMAIVADLGTDVDTDRYSVYAFVGDECRGEGKAVNGRYFITAYGKQGEYVTLRVIDNETGEIQTANSLQFAQAVGSLKSPVKLNVNVSGIENITVDADQLDDNAVIYDLQGRRLGKGAKGLLIVNGKKVFVK